MYLYWAVSCCFAGNKKDLEDIREVKLQQAQNFAAHNDILEVIETSAKDNTNINEAFVRMAKVCEENKRKEHLNYFSKSLCWLDTRNGRSCLFAEKFCSALSSC